jgi:acetylornithine deacetylase/succinyl-diaminopimelate desuccinylase-like protein
MSATTDEDIGALVAGLVAIDSVNPGLVADGPGEGRVARFVVEWLAARGVVATFDEIEPGRPNVIARVGAGGDRKLLLLAHTDTVGAGSMRAPFEPRIEGGSCHGRGAYDMKAGLAAAMAAAAALGDVAGQLVIAAVCDEEAGGIGTRALLASGERFDAAIVPEPTDLEIAVAHKGFVGFEIETSGRAAHGSRPDLGVDAILAMAPVLEALRALDERLRSSTRHRLLGTASLHASLIEGGQEASTYPERCVLTGECRTLPGEDVAGLLRAAIERAAPHADLRITYTGDAFETPEGAEILGVLARHAKAPIVGADYWADSALLAAAGIPTVLYGPRGAGAHAAEEWVELDSVARLRDVLIATAREFLAADAGSAPSHRSTDAEQ